jgi:glycerate kinase
VIRLVIAPQAFKGTLAAPEVTAAIAAGLRRVLPQAELTLLPLADGGEGTVQALVDATGGRILNTTVSGPLGKPVQAEWGVLGDGNIAVIEMAAASGLPLVPPEKRNPLLASSYGTGELIRAALDAGCRDFIVGIGGSATNDGGTGMAKALGVRFLDPAGNELPLGASPLIRLAHIELDGLDPRVRESRFRVACDVTNPLVGPTGASAVYGPQKGATPQMVLELEAYLQHLAIVIELDLGLRVADLPGAGAAGGLGAGLVAFLGATLQPGADIVLEATRFAERCAGASLIFTGEGRLDGQTLFGKTVAAVARIGKQMGIPVIAVAGGIAPDGYVLLQHGVDAMLGITPRPMTLEEASRNAAELLSNAGEQVMRLLVLGSRLGNQADT